MPEPRTGPITPDLDGLRRLERRVRRAMSLKAALARVWSSLPAILQVTAAAVASYAIAHYALGHPLPIVAVTVTITSLGFNRDARPVRVLRSVLAILFGVVLATGILELAGSGLWQLVVVLLVVLVAARMLVRDLVFPVAAATPAALTVLLGDLYGDPFLRVFDACVAAAIALLATALIPRAPGRDAARDGRSASSSVSEAVEALADALRLGSLPAAELANARLARVPALVEAWTQSLETARAVGRISPWLRGRRAELERSARLLRAMAAAHQHLDLLGRRIGSMVRDGSRHAALAALVAEVERGVGLLVGELGGRGAAGAGRTGDAGEAAREADTARGGGADPAGEAARQADGAHGGGGADTAREVLMALAGRLSPQLALGTAASTETAVVLQLRPLVVDLLIATGLDAGEARDVLAPL